MSDYTLADLAADLNGAAIRVDDDVDKVLHKAANNIKKKWRADVSGNAHLPQFPYSINYEKQGDGYEIGPEKDKTQGPLGHLIEYGSPNNAPGNQGKNALTAETPNLERYLIAALFNRLKG